MQLTFGVVTLALGANNRICTPIEQIPGLTISHVEIWVDNVTIPFTISSGNIVTATIPFEYPWIGKQMLLKINYPGFNPFIANWTIFGIDIGTNETHPFQKPLKISLARPYYIVDGVEKKLTHAAVYAHRRPYTNDIYLYSTTSAEGEQFIYRLFDDPNFDTPQTALVQSNVYCSPKEETFKAVSRLEILKPNDCCGNTVESDICAPDTSFVIGPVTWHPDIKMQVENECNSNTINEVSLLTNLNAVKLYLDYSNVSKVLIGTVLRHVNPFPNISLEQIDTQDILRNSLRLNINLNNNTIADLAVATEEYVPVPGESYYYYDADILTFVVVLFNLISTDAIGDWMLRYFYRIPPQDIESEDSENYVIRLTDFVTVKSYPWCKLSILNINKIKIENFSMLMLTVTIYKLSSTNEWFEIAKAILDPCEIELLEHEEDGVYKYHISRDDDFVDYVLPLFGYLEKCLFDKDVEISLLDQPTDKQYYQFALLVFNLNSIVALTTDLALSNYVLNVLDKDTLTKLTTVNSLIELSLKKACASCVNTKAIVTPCCTTS